jgi:uncharacterized protein (TIGR03084 family)
VDQVVEDLAAQHEELREILVDLSAAEWRAPTRCEGWDVSDVVIHLAQTDEMAIGSAEGRYEEALGKLVDGVSMATSVDDAVAKMVANERGIAPAQLLARWSAAAAILVDVLDGMDLSQRVTWVTGELSARSMATTRLAETWIHSGDISEAVSRPLVPADRLQNIARLAWRTLPYAFSSAGKTMAGPIAFHLTSPSGENWNFDPDGEAVTVITGPGADLCAVASRRAVAADTNLVGEGPDAEDVLALVRTYA